MISAHCNSVSKSQRSLNMDGWFEYNTIGQCFLYQGVNGNMKLIQRVRKICAPDDVDMMGLKWLSEDNNKTQYSREQFHTPAILGRFIQMSVPLLVLMSV